MPKQFSELIELEEIRGRRKEQSSIFRIKGTEKWIPQENVEILQHTPFVIRRLLGHPERTNEERPVPEEADSYIGGERIMESGKARPEEFQSASYCRIRRESEMPTRYTLKECQHRICDCHMVESPRGEFVKFKG